MKKSLALLAAMPSLALAHAGHGGLGLFHHAVDVALMVIVAAALVAGWQYSKRR